MFDSRIRESREMHSYVKELVKMVSVKHFCGAVRFLISFDSTTLLHQITNVTKYVYQISSNEASTQTLHAL